MPPPQPDNGQEPIGLPQNRLTAVLAMDRPVILAPMAAVAGGALADAVTRSGGFGIVAAGYGDPRLLDEQMRLVTTTPFGIGVITWSMPEGFLGTVLEHRPKAVWLSFADPSPHIPAIHAAGSRAICQVATVAEARQAAEARADVIVAQGREAGGHGRLAVPLLELLETLSAEIPSIPLVAAGGITDREDFDRAIGAGADGVAIGTALYATHEALGVDQAKQRLVAAGPSDTIASTVYDHIRGPVWPDGYRARSLRTSLTRAWAGNEGALAPHLESLREEYTRAVADHDDDIPVVWAGQGVGGITGILPAATIIHRFPRTTSQ